MCRKRTKTTVQVGAGKSFSFQAGKKYLPRPRCDKSAEQVDAVDPVPVAIKDQGGSRCVVNYKVGIGLVQISVIHLYVCWGRRTI